MSRFPAVLVLFLTSASAFAAQPATSPPRAIRVEGVLVTPLDHVQVPARLGGVLTSLAAREGLWVEEGGELGRIEDDEARLKEQRAQADLEIARQNSRNDVSYRYAQKSWEVAGAELKRSRESIERYPKSVSTTEIDRLRLATEKAELEMEQAQRDMQVAKFTEALRQNDLELAQWDVARRKIVAPVSGMVVQVHRQRGEWLQPGDAVLRIVRLDRLRAEGFLQAREVPRHLEGCPVTLTVDLGQRQPTQFAGKIRFASPEIDPVNGQFRFWAEIENPELLLRPGQQGMLTIDLTAPHPSR